MFSFSRHCEHYDEEYVMCVFFFLFLSFRFISMRVNFFFLSFSCRYVNYTNFYHTHVYIDIAYIHSSTVYFLFFGKKSQSSFEHIRLPMYRINRVSLVWKIAYRISREKKGRKTTNLSIVFIVSSNSNFHLNVSRRCCAIHIYRSTRNSNFGSLRRLVRFYLVNARIYRNFSISVVISNYHSLVPEC